MRKFIFCNIVFYSIFNFSQELNWQKTIGGEQAEYLYNTIATPDNGFILVGSSHSGISGNKTKVNQGGLDYFVWKLDQNGNQEWQNSFGGDKTDFLQTVALTKDGGYILGGSSESSISGDKTEPNFGSLDYWIIKLNAKGEQEWQKTFGGNAQDELISIEQTQDGGYIIGGNSESDEFSAINHKLIQNNRLSVAENSNKTSQHFGNQDFWILKLDKKGNIEWQKSFGGKSVELLRAVKQIQNGEYILVGYSNSFNQLEINNELEKPNNYDLEHKTNSQNGDFLVIKIDANGNQIWQKSFGGTGDDHPFTMILTKNQDILIGGTSDSETSDTKKAKKQNEADFWLLKIDQNANYIWDKTFDYGKYDKLVSISENKDGSLILGGYAQTENPLGQDKKGINDYIFLKTDDKANKKWEQIFGGNESDILIKAIETRDGNYVLAGTSNSEISRNKRVANKGQNDFWIIKVNDQENNKNKLLENIEIYPNPTERFVNIILTENFKTNNLLPKANLFDLSGAFLQEIQIVSSTTVVDLNPFPKGIYILNIKTDKEDITKKIIKN